MIEQFYRPETLEQAVALKARHGDQAVYLAGGSKLNATPTRTDKTIAIALDRLGLDQVSQTDGALRIGATITLQALRDHPLAPPALRQALGFVYSRHLRNQATLGGEVAAQGHDPVLLPLLLVMQAELLLEDGVRVPLETYLAGPREALIQAIELPRSRQCCATRRVTRNADGVSVVTAAVALEDGGAMRLAVSGVVPGALRLHAVEQRQLQGEALEQAVRAAITPCDDFVGSAAYKRYITGVVLADLLADCRQQKEQ
ncbi:molybdopterin-dependent oxidoreductase FAD-binding subunit [Paludibacterium sp. B53371]|nr:molybdopterin-dependent oxidoreductase FAD-binding subunit [Paludibacterium sp. B53371]BEV71552.1 molybdopterin-dependent oxidoreductase FAD-binding subunit [Paludibacterium sp. THUN1379]